MSVVLKALVALLVVVSVAVVVHGFLSGAWMGGLLYAALTSVVIHQWWSSRNMSGEARDVVDRMFIAIFVIMAMLARPAIDSLETMAFG